MRPALRILYAITRADAGGAQTHLSSLMQGLPEEYDLAVAVGEEGYVTDSARRRGARVFIVPALTRSIRPDLNLRAALGIRRIIADWHPDVVHAHCLNAGLAGRLAACWSGCPSVYTVHGWQFAKGVPKLQRLVAFLVEWLGARFGSAIITICKYDQETAVAWRIAKKPKVILVHHGVEDCSVRASAIRAKQEVVFVMVARFMPQKDQLSLIKACEKVSGKWKLWFVGDGPTIGLARAEVERLGLEERILFLGHQSDVVRILASADIFVLISHYEGLPGSIVEAMRAGLPVVASNVGGVAEGVQDGKNGFLVPHGNLVALRGALTKLIQSPQLRAAMGAVSRQLYEDQFTARQMVEETVKVYKMATSENACNPDGPTTFLIAPP